MNINLKDIFKFNNEEEYNNFVNDTEVNYPKYKKALYDFYKSNNEKFPFEEFSFKDNLIFVIFLNEYNYNHDIVLKALDEILIPNLDSKLALMYILPFLHGFNVISENEMNERCEYIDLLKNGLNKESDTE